jgi:hypothetical protein
MCTEPLHHDELSVIVNPGHEAVVTTFDVEHDAIAHPIGGVERVMYIVEGPPVRGLSRPPPGA